MRKESEEQTAMTLLSEFWNMVTRTFEIVGWSDSALVALVRWLLRNIAKAVSAARSGVGRPRKPPGANLLALAEFFYSPKTLTRVFKPIVSDLRDEYCEALGAGRRNKARWVRIRGTYSFCSAVLANGVASLFHLMRKAIAVLS